MKILPPPPPDFLGFFKATLQTLAPKNFRVNVVGDAPDYITAKDIALAVIGEIGTAGGTGYVLEYAGPAIEALTMDVRRHS